MNKKISIVIPVYNESRNLPAALEALATVAGALADRYDCEIIFIDDGSTDGSDKVLAELAGKDPRVSYISFSRNFGKEIALTAGLQRASGDAVIMADADLQHPYELIPEFLVQWEAGAEVVIGVRKSNQGEGLLKCIGSWFFYSIMQLISDVPLVRNATDFRLLDRRVADEFNKFTERNRMTRALIDWLGFRREYIYFTARGRTAGRARYSFIKLVHLAIASLVAHSFFPLKLAAYLGAVISFCSGMVGLFILIEKYIFGDPMRLIFSWPATLVVMVLFLIGIVLICLGLVAFYIGHIKDEVTNRPLYVVKTESKRQ